MNHITSARIEGDNLEVTSEAGLWYIPILGPDANLQETFFGYTLQTPTRLQTFRFLPNELILELGGEPAALGRGAFGGDLVLNDAAKIQWFRTTLESLIWLKEFQRAPVASIGS